MSCSGLESIIVQSFTVNIGISCFEDCANLKSITILTRFVNIENRCFKGCFNMQNISLYKAAEESESIPDRFAF
jgi:hypothetical protein